MKTDLIALAERCEAATGADMELDALVWCAVNGLEPWQRVIDDFKQGQAIRYTASLDAAMTLVPEGLEVALYWGVKGFKPEAQLEQPSRPVDEIICGTAETIALALCAAALRARTTQEASNAE